MVKRVIVVLYFTFYFLHFAVAQQGDFPKGYFQFPIYPGQKNTLAGVLGDLRTNHFHAGIDVRTQQREGLPVSAAANGYVSKIKVQTGGYGNVIFVKHPNGMTTVYGHLRSFANPMGDYLRQKQYERKTFEIELNPSPGQFTVTKGELIGISGNTGGSAGPHLHFEIRDDKDNYLNPLFFGFPEIEDDRPPYFNSLVIKPMTISSRVNEEFERVTAKPIRQKDGNYTLSQTIKGWGLMGIELIAFDAMTGVNFRNGVNCVEIKMDGKEVFAYNMTSFPNWTTRDYNNLIDYATEQKSGLRYLKCYNPDGNQLGLQRTNGYRGKLYIADTLEHQVKITLFDSFENAAILEFTIKGQIAEGIFVNEEAADANPSFVKADATENVLKLTAFGLAEPMAASVFVKNKNVALLPAYQTSTETVYLVDLTKQLPDSVQIGNKTFVTNYRKAIKPNISETYINKNYEISFGTQSIFDTLNLAVQAKPNGLVINDDITPLRDAIGVSFRPQEMPDNAEHTHVYRIDGGRSKFVGGKWNYNNINFTTRELGIFELMTDTIAPSIRLMRADKKGIAARISDGLSGIEKFSAYINGEWVLMNYDYKRAYIWSDKLVDSLDFEGELRLEVTDQAGNVATLQSEIKEIVIVPKKSKKNAATKRRTSTKVRSTGSKRKRR